MLTHYNLVANLAQCDFIEQSVAGDHVIGVLPVLPHIYAAVVALHDAQTWEVSALKPYCPL